MPFKLNYRSDRNYMTACKHRQHPKRLTICKHAGDRIQDQIYDYYYNYHNNRLIIISRRTYENEKKKPMRDSVDHSTTYVNKYPQMTHFK